jgi:hypothetical protein
MLRLGRPFVVAGVGVCTTTAGSGLLTAAQNPTMISYGARVGTGVTRLARGDTVCSLGGDWCTPADGASNSKSMHGLERWVTGESWPGPSLGIWGLS